MRHLPCQQTCFPFHGSGPDVFKGLMSSTGRPHGQETRSTRPELVTKRSQQRSRLSLKIKVEQGLSESTVRFRLQLCTEFIYSKSFDITVEQNKRFQGVGQPILHQSSSSIIAEHFLWYKGYDGPSGEKVKEDIQSGKTQNLRESAGMYARLWYQYVQKCAQDLRREESRLKTMHVQKHAFRWRMLLRLERHL